MESQVLRTRREVVSAIICTFEGGRECAAARIGLPLKKFDNHAYENNNCRPLTDAQIFQLERVTGTQHLPNYVAAMYGGMFVPVIHPENLDNVEMYSRSIQSSIKRGTVDQAIAQALEDGVITDDEAELIQNAHTLHMAARTAEVYAAIDLYRAKSGKAK
ncbi:Phage protein [Pseudomonas orientalis]|uniref:YmfL family putative regulatory protein n=1 Tax=Pseudomonas orientalis TaxID=76758 RepID=UPI000F58D6E6|nr:YmfL family putative regulatory protein [Pseudomonas orientalis]AZE96012.1 Phage protein [Pseudomonas orientalis]